MYARIAIYICDGDEGETRLQKLIRSQIMRSLVSMRWTRTRQSIIVASCWPHTPPDSINPAPCAHQRATRISLAESSHDDLAETTSCKQAFGIWMAPVNARTDRHLPLERQHLNPFDVRPRCVMPNEHKYTYTQISAPYTHTPLHPPMMTNWMCVSVCVCVWAKQRSCMMQLRCDCAICCGGGDSRTTIPHMSQSAVQYAHSSRRIKAIHSIVGHKHNTHTHTDTSAHI